MVIFLSEMNSVIEIGRRLTEVEDFSSLILTENYLGFYVNIRNKNYSYVCDTLESLTSVSPFVIGIFYSYKKLYPYKKF